MSETGEGALPSEPSTVGKVKKYFRSGFDYEAEQEHINKSNSPLKGLLQRLHDYKLTNAGIIDRIKNRKSKQEPKV